MTARSLRWLPPALLLAVAANQLRLAYRADLTPWCGGGFGMFSTFDGRFARHLHAYALSPSLRIELEIPFELQEQAQSAVALPSDSRLRAFARELEPYAVTDFEAPDAIRIEVFTTNERGGPALAAGKPKPSPETNPAAVGKAARGGVLLCADAASGKVLWEASVTDQPLGGGQWSFVSPMVGSGVVCVLSNRLLLFSAENGKRLGNPSLQVPVLKCTSLAVAGDCLVARDSKALVCYKAAKH